MLSIVIPTYNCPCVALVNELVRQIDTAQIVAEIIVIDDASTDPAALAANEVIARTKYCRYIKLTENVSIAKVRNRLFAEAQYKYVLSLDADVFPVRNDFVVKYLEAAPTADVVRGGWLYRTDEPQKVCPLRYKYGVRYEVVSVEERRKHPYAQFIAASYLINRETTRDILFDETSGSYGFEDLHFGVQLESAQRTITHIDNPVYHDVGDTSERFIRKTLLAVENIVEHADVIGGHSRLLNFYRKVERWHLTWLPRLIYKYLRSPIERQLCSSNPSIWLFTLYKLSYCAYYVDKQK